jgi:hypothetical protein
MTARSRLWMAASCAGVATLAAIAAALGVFARGSGEFITVTSARGQSYEMATTGVYAYNAQRVVAEGVGWDSVTLGLAVPALLAVVPLVARGSFRGRLFAAGLLGFFLYQYLEYSVTWAFGPLFLLFVGTYGLSLVTIGWLAWSLVIDHPTALLGQGFPRRRWAALNIALSGLLTIMWLQRIALALGGQSDLLMGETTLTVQALDLGLVVPASVLSAVLVLRRTQLGYALAAAFGVTFVAMTTAITGMLLSAWAVEGSLEIVPVTIFALASLSATRLLVLIYRPLNVERASLRARGAEAAPAGLHG